MTDYDVIWFEHGATGRLCSSTPGSALALAYATSPDYKKVGGPDQETDLTEQPEASTEQKELKQDGSESKPGRPDQKNPAANKRQK